MIRHRFNRPIKAAPPASVRTPQRQREDRKQWHDRFSPQELVIAGLMPDRPDLRDYIEVIRRER